MLGPKVLVLVIDEGNIRKKCLYIILFPALDVLSIRTCQSLNCEAASDLILLLCYR